MRFALLGRWAPAVAWACLLIFLGTRPPDALPAGPSGFDKLAHLAFYAALGLLVARAGRSLALSVAAGLLVGGLDEWLQSGIAGRTTDLLDLAADVVGAALGGLVYLYLRTRRGARRS